MADQENDLDREFERYFPVFLQAVKAKTNEEVKEGPKKYLWFPTYATGLAAMKLYKSSERLRESTERLHKSSKRIERYNTVLAFLTCALIVLTFILVLRTF
jgi:predicted nucleic acid-binding Zn ribbon protein